MKIITRKQLMDSPAGTVFSYYTPSIFRDLCVKDSDPDELAPDFLVSDLIGAVKHESSEEFIEVLYLMEKGVSVPVDFEFSGREGLFDEKQLFAVYEREDIKKLIVRLTKTL